MPKRTPRLTFSAPAIKRHTFKEEYGAEWRKLRAERITAEPLCRHCLARGQVTEARQVDHITPLALGGKHEWDNTQSLCVPCHQAKTREDMKRMPL